MERIIKTVDPKDYQRTLDFVYEVFSESENNEEGLLVKTLVNEIRSKKYYEKELDLMMVNENDEVIGLALFSRFHIEGKYENELLLLSPVAVKSKYQRQHISKELIEYGINKARQLGYLAIIVEGNPLNYRSRGFKTSADYGIYAHESIHLPAKECLMVLELKENALENISGFISYDFYETLR